MMWSRRYKTRPLSAKKLATFSVLMKIPWHWCPETDEELRVKHQPPQNVAVEVDEFIP